MSQVIRGDCLEVLPTLEANQFDLMIADPPYFLPATHYQTRMQFKRNFADLGILESFFKRFFAEVERLVKPTGTFYVFCDGQSYPLFYYYSYFFTKSVRPLIWDKGTSINGFGWRHQHELILYAEMPDSKPVPTGDGDVLRCQAVPIDKRKHPAQKPIELVSRFITKSSREGESVLDPFAGYGTVADACQTLRRVSTSIEIDSTYAEALKKRLISKQETILEVS